MNVCWDRSEKKLVLENDRSDDCAVCVADFETLPVHMLAVSKFFCHQIPGARPGFFDGIFNVLEFGAVRIDKQLLAVSDV